MLATDIRIADIALRYDDFAYRTPIKFGGVALDRATILNVHVNVETMNGQQATGFGSMPLGNVWAWPSKTLGYADTLREMKAMAESCVRAFRNMGSYHHPIRIGHEVETVLRSATETWHSSRHLAEPMPLLATLVVASAFDAAVHDGFGKIHGRNCYSTYSREFFPDDLSDYLGREFAGRYLEEFIRPTPQPTMPLYHLVGALDPLTPSDVVKPVGDGLPETLGEWIQRDGLTHLKIKLNGDDLEWDVERVVRVNAIADESAADRAYAFSLDFNERCKDVAYLIEFLRQLRDRTPKGYDRVQYIEQPTARDLKANPANRMHEAAKFKPVVIDESLLDLETLYLARDMGYTGVAFKACKGQSQSLLLAAAAQTMNLFRCVQDLTCPGASLIHSAGLAARIPGVVAIEANSRQYCPSANVAWEPRFPGLFTIRNGVMPTGLLTGAGLGATA